MFDQFTHSLTRRLFEQDPQVDFDSLDMNLEVATLRKDPKTKEYVMHLTTSDGQVELNARIKPVKAPVRHGLNGVVKGHGGDDMFYYLIPR